MTFSERYVGLGDMFVVWFITFKPFRRNERQRDDGGEKLTEISMFFARRDLVIYFFSPNFGCGS